MKKITLLIISLILLVSLCACKRDITDEPAVELNPTGIESEYSDIEGVRIRIPKSMFEPAPENLEVIWINDTDKELVFGEVFSVEKYTAEGWKSVVKENIAFSLIAYILPANSKQIKEYSVKDRFDISDEGTYRFISSCTVDDKKCSVWATFVVDQNITSAPEATVPLPDNGTEPSDFYGYCGNTQTTIYVDGKAYTFMFGNSVYLTDLLRRLEYKDDTCDCGPEYIIDTEFGTGYGISLSEGYARYKDKQTSLSQQQLEEIRRIIQEETQK